MNVRAVVHQQIRYDYKGRGEAFVSTELFEFDDRRWVDVSADEVFRERLGPVGIYTVPGSIAKPGGIRVTAFGEKRLVCFPRGGMPIITVAENWSLDEAWLYVLSLPPGGSAADFVILDARGDDLRFALGIGTDGRLCHYLYSTSPHAIEVRARIRVDGDLYEAARKSLGNASFDGGNAASGARAARWLLTQHMPDESSQAPQWASTVAGALLRDLSE